MPQQIGRVLRTLPAITLDFCLSERPCVSELLHSGISSRDPDFRYLQFHHWIVSTRKFSNIVVRMNFPLVSIYMLTSEELQNLFVDTEHDATR